MLHWIFKWINEQNEFGLNEQIKQNELGFVSVQDTKYILAYGLGF